MSWAEEDWTVGLSGKVLQKVKELQVHHERLCRENKQKQLLLDNIQTSLEKQTAKYDEARVELQSSHRELQRVQEEAKAAITSKERLSQDLQSKQAQVFSLEGQLDTARSLSNKLAQEVKRLEAELEKLQNSSSRAAETTLFSTPCWSTSSWELSGSRKEERHGNREEGKTQGLHVRRLQFSDKPSGSLPREQPRGAHHCQTPDVFSTPSAAFPWERDDARPITRRHSPVSPKTPKSDVLSQSQLEPDLSVKINNPNDSEPDSFMSELRCRLTGMEEELTIKVQRLNTIQNEVTQNKKELAAKEMHIQRLRDELSLAHTCMSQEGERASTAEQKAKQLQEELKCQRQNAESSRVQHHQRTKELEKQHQRDLQEFQKERLFLERQHQQEINKLNQELAQARAQHNALQAQMDKESVQKQALMKEVETLKEKLNWTEGQVQQSQKKEAQTQSKMTEALREADALTVSLKQSQKKERALEEDGRRLTEERDNALCLLRDLQEQKAAMASLQSLQICPPAHSLSQISVSNASQPLHPSRKLNPTNSTKQKREEVDSREEIKVPFPTDREPGEGIDSEHISDNHSIKSEGLQRRECRSPTKIEEILETVSIQTFAERTLTHSSKQAMPSADLRVENAALCSELRDLREELQKRLDDLEAQRQAEMEAKTRLKQLSRKNATQITEKEEQYKECKTQLEKERSEVARLKKALAALETEMMRETQEKCVKKNGENNTVLQEKEDEMIELNMELKKQLSEVKAQLVLEREERKQQEVEMMNKTSTDMKKMEELEVEIEKLKSSQYNSQAEESLTAANSPVTYLTLRADKFNSDVVNTSNKPETPSFCQSTNQCNANISQVLGHFVSSEVTSLIDSQLSPATVNDLEQESLNHEENMVRTSDNAGNADELSVLTTQVQFLQKQNTLEKEKANQYQIKLEVLQNQVTQQTQQLTMAFEMQSQHISGLLVELQDKENAILQKEEEIQLCRKQISALKDKIVKEDGLKEDMEQDHDKEEPSSTCIKSLVADSCIEGTVQLTPNAESPADDTCQHIKMQNMTEHTTQHKQSLVNEVNNGSNDGANLATELLHLQKENHLLKLKIKSVTAPKPSGTNTDIKSAALLEEQTPTVLSGLGVRKDGEEQPEAGSLQLDHIGHLLQQVVALQTKLQAMSEENQQKTEELTLWRLSSGAVCPLTDSEPVQHKQEHGPVDLQNTALEQNGCVSLLREDEILLSCSANKLQGRTLFSRLDYCNGLLTGLSKQAVKQLQYIQNAAARVLTRTRKLQKNIIEPKTLPPFLILQEHKKNHSEADKENTSPTQHNQRNDTKNICRSLGPEPSHVPDCCTVNPSKTEVKVIESIKRDSEVYMKCVSTQTESLCVSPEPQFTHTPAEAEVELPSVSPAAFYEIQQSKGVRLTAAFPIPADPARLAERIRQNRTQLSAAFDDTEYEPYGLPEVVMKGFADIPSGPSCPYIVRRGLLGTAAVPVLPKNMADVDETD